MTEKEFIDELKKIEIEVTDKQLNDLNAYFSLLIEWNEKINLTAITEKKQVYLKHFYDSLTITKIIDLKTIDSLCDIGTGAGFPGIVLKIFFPNLNITLVDSLNKRVEFLKIVISELKLKNIIAIHSRVEEYAKTNREKFDVVTARAVASLNILLEYAVPLIKLNKYFIPLKGNIAEEINNVASALKVLDAQIVDSKEFYLPIENSNRTILKFTKTKTTNPKFPRKYSEIKGKSL